MLTLIRTLILLPVRLFYPQIAVLGREHLPTGPRLFVLNHPNGLVDALVLMLGLGVRPAFLAKSTFFTNPLGRLVMRAFAALPIYRRKDASQPGGAANTLSANSATFANCRALLRAGGALVIFPEGTNSGATMLPFHSGAARLALETEAEAQGQAVLQIVPVGLWYRQRASFRSPVVLHIGPALSAATELAGYYQNPHMAVDGLTFKIRAALERLVLQAEHAQTLETAATLAEWLVPPGAAALTERYHTTAALLAITASCSRQAARYGRALRWLRVANPWQLQIQALSHRAHRGMPSQSLCALCALWQIGKYVVLTPLALMGGICCLSLLLARPLVPLLTGRSGRTAAAPLIVGSALLLGWWAVLALVASWYWGVLAGALLLLVAPALAYLALRCGEGWQRLAQMWQARWLGWRHPRLVARLVAGRRALATLCYTKPVPAEDALIHG